MSKHSSTHLCIWKSSQNMPTLCTHFEHKTHVCMQLLYSAGSAEQTGARRGRQIGKNLQFGICIQYLSVCSVRLARCSFSYNCCCCFTFFPIGYCFCCYQYFTPFYCNQFSQFDFDVIARETEVGSSDSPCACVCVCIYVQAEQGDGVVLCYLSVFSI